MKPAKKGARISGYLTTTSMGYCEQFFGLNTGGFCRKVPYDKITSELYWATFTHTINPNEIILFKTI